MIDGAGDPQTSWADRWLGRAFPLVAWLFVACIVIQFFLVGLRAFEVEPYDHLHGDFAYLYGWLTPILVLLAASPAGSRRALRLAVALLALFAVQTFLPLIAETVPLVGAVHAANALVVAWLALQLARESSTSPGRAGTPLR